MIRQFRLWPVSSGSKCLIYLSTLQALYQLPYSTYGPESLRLPWKKEWHRLILNESESRRRQVQNAGPIGSKLKQQKNLVLIPTVCVACLPCSLLFPQRASRLVYYHLQQAEISHNYFFYTRTSCVGHQTQTEEDLRCFLLFCTVKIIKITQ